MDLLILDEGFNGIETLDIFESLIWTDRYSEYGDFEIYTSASLQMLNKLKQDRYLWNRESDHVMIVEDIEITTDIESGSHLCITGRSLESILERRIVWNQTIIRGNLQNGIKKLLDENVIAPTDENRKISNFVFETSEDEEVTRLTVSAQYTGDNLYDVISSLCKSFGIGFKILLSDDGKFVFSLYAGKDRSYDQTLNPYVVFSPGFDNILNSNYVESKKTLKTVTLVAGEGEGSDRKTITAECNDGAGTGLSRRELYTDARDISMTAQEGITEAEYLLQLTQRGQEALADNVATKSFEGEVDSARTYKFGEDYYIGDVVQVINEFGIESRSRVEELVISQSTSGIEMYPTFTIISYQNTLPSGYIRLKYLESSGSQYINTGIYPNQDTIVECDCERTETTSSDQFLFGSETKNSDNTYTGYGIMALLAARDSGRDDYGALDPDPTNDLFDISKISGRISVSKIVNVLYINDEKIKEHTYANFSIPYPMYIFTTNTVGSPHSSSYHGRLYSFKIYSSSNLVRNFQPAKNSDGEVGLYDYVNGRFYTNSGSGKFSYG